MHKIRWKNHTKNSIRKKIILPMILILLLQTVLFFSTVFFGGLLGQLNRNAFSVFNERVTNRRNYLQDEMTQRWTNLGESLQSVETTMKRYQQENAVTTESLLNSTEHSNQLLDTMFNDIYYLLRKQYVTGAFVVLNSGNTTNDREVLKNGQSLSKAGLYVRDMDPDTNPSDTSDLLLERSSPSISKKLGISLDSQWEPQFHFEPGDHTDSYQFFYEPFYAALSHPTLESLELGYWSRPFFLNDEDIEIITYSVPLFDENKSVYGVMGVEVSTDYLKKQLPYDELTDEKSASYILAITTGTEQTYEYVLANGPTYERMAAGSNQVKFEEKPVFANTYRYHSDQKADTFYGSVQPLHLYNSNTPFESQRWTLIGLAPERQLLHFSGEIKTSLIVTLALSLLFGILAAFLVSRQLTKPVVSLAQEIRTINPRHPVKLHQTKIAEIDELSAAIETLSQDVMDSASKLSQIIEMTSTQIGAFEHKPDSSMVYYTKQFFPLLGLEATSEDEYIQLDRFKQLMEPFHDALEQEFDNAWILRIPNGNQMRWVRLKITEDSTRILGIVEDVTQEIIEKKKIEYERDYDILTNLLNRRAFYAAMDELFQNPELIKTGCLMMFDLDNLKFINDTYGHDFGDQYIRRTAQILSMYTPQSCLLSRMSGDEFFVFMYGYSSKEELSSVIETLKNGFFSTEFPLPDQPHFTIRASAGVAWYPTDSTSYEELIRYADFAMYTAKNSTKGAIRAFNEEEYRKNSYLLQSPEKFNRLIDEKLVYYDFQPIVSAIDGSVHGYEALMRSNIDSLRLPNEILTLARSQSKLYQVEKLTWFQALSSFSKYTDASDGCKLFINSIANQGLSAQDTQLLEKRFQKYLHRVVIEITEDERPDEKSLNSKIEHLSRWSGSLALDDFGNGFNGETTMLQYSPQYIKVDRSIINKIDQDKDRQNVFLMLATYAQEHGIKVIAEGIETYEEMKTLIALEVDYMQGFYLGMPNPGLQPPSAKIVKEIQALHS